MVYLDFMLMNYWKKDIKVFFSRRFQSVFDTAFRNIFADYNRRL